MPTKLVEIDIPEDLGLSLGTMMFPKVPHPLQELLLILGRHSEMLVEQLHFDCDPVDLRRSLRAGARLLEAVRLGEQTTVEASPEDLTEGERALVLGLRGISRQLGEMYALMREEADAREVQGPT